MILYKTPLKGLQNCPHCGISMPNLRKVWCDDLGNQRMYVWAAFKCEACEGVVSVRFISHPKGYMLVESHPDIWKASDTIPDTAKKYLQQAKQTISSPDASVVMSASSIDAMLKDNGIDEKNLFKGIDKAVDEGIITKGMSKWAHLVRLESNKPRHVDKEKPHMTKEDAERAFDFAKALGEILYSLPNRMPVLDTQTTNP